MASSKDRPQNKNLISFADMTPEERRAIQSKGGKASQAARKRRTEQAYLLGKLANAPILERNTIAKYKKLGFEDDEMCKALEVTAAIMEGCKKGDPRMIEIYLKLTGEDKPEAVTKTNNLLDAIRQAVKEDVATDDLPELQQKAEPNADVVE